MMSTPARLVQCPDRELLIEHSLNLQPPHQFMDGNQVVSIATILLLLAVRLTIGTCCSLTCSNLTTNGSSDKPGKLDSCLIFSLFNAAVAKVPGTLSSPETFKVRLKGALGNLI